MFNNDTFLRVNKSINEYGELIEGKTENAYRYEILPQLALDIIKDEENFLKENHVISKYLFPELNGNHLKPQYISARFNKYAEYHKLSCDTLHELRHPYVKPTTKNIFYKIRKPKLPFPISCDFCFDYKLLDTLVHFNSS